MDSTKKTNRYAVAYVNLFDNDLKIDIVEATDEKSALLKHSIFQDDQHMVEFVNSIDGDMDQVQEEMFNCDVLVQVKEIK